MIIKSRGYIPRIDENCRDIYIKSHKYIITGTVFLSLNNNYSNHIQAMKSNDTFKSSDSIDTTIATFIDIPDIPQDNNQASLTSPDGNYFIRDNVGW